MNKTDRPNPIIDPIAPFDARPKDRGGDECEASGDDERHRVVGVGVGDEGERNDDETHPPRKTVERRRGDRVR